MSRKPRRTIRAVLYLRVSLDRTGEHLAVERQRDECTAIASSRGWTIVREYVDNSISASDASQNRPAYDRLEGDYLAGGFDALLCWDLDRLTRQPRQLEDWIDAAEKRGLLLVTANGECDLQTDGGRLFARIKLAVAKGEMDRKSARQKAAHRQRVEKGKPWGNIRPFGYVDPHLSALHKGEADVVRQIYADIIAGQTQAEVCRGLNAKGITTSHGNMWRQSSLRQLVMNPRSAGIIQHTTKDTQGNKVTVLGGKGTWEPIVTEVTWRAAVAVLTPDTPRKGGGKRVHLLSGLAVCGVCGSGLRAGSTRSGAHIYSCFDNFCVGRAQEALDKFICGLVVHRLSQPDAAELVARTDAAVDVAELQAEAHAAREALDHLAEMYGAGQLPLSAFSAGAQRATEQLEAITSSLTDAGKADRLGALVGKDDVQAAWDELELERKRAVIDALMAIEVLPAGKGTRKFNPDHVAITWRASDEDPPNRRPGPRPGHRVGQGSQGRVPGHRKPRAPSGASA